MFAAMWKSRSPEEFVEKYLLKGLAVRQLPDARVVSLKMGGKQPAGIDKLMASLGRGDYHRIAFINKADSKKICYFQIEKTDYKNPRIKDRYPRSLPKIRLFKESIIHVGEDDFNRAVARTGEKVFPHPGRGGSVSHLLLIPRKLVDHGEWGKKIVEPPPGIQPGALNILLERGVFEKLEGHQRIEQFLNKYLNSVKYVGGEHSTHTYEKLIGIGPKSRQKYPGFSPYQLFHVVSSRYGPFMRELPAAASRAEVEKMIEKHLGAGKLFAMDYGERIWKVISTPGGMRDAKKIAADTSMNWRKIRGRE